MMHLERTTITLTPEQAAGSTIMDTQGGLVGTYIVKAGTRGVGHRPVPTACPYCHEIMQLVPPGSAARVMQMGERMGFQTFRALMEEVPSTHQTLICPPCRQVFTVLAQPMAEALEAGR